MCGSRLNRSLPLPPATRKRHLRLWSRRAMPIPSPYRPCKPPACWLYQTVIPVGSTGAVVGSPSVPKISVSGTSIFEEIQPRRYWVCEPSFSEGFRNRLRRPTSAEPHPNGRHWASQCGPAPGHFGLGLCPRGGGASSRPRCKRTGIRGAGWQLRFGLRLRCVLRLSSGLGRRRRLARRGGSQPRRRR
jgi:hypothetical protein